jgi:hypothetical protein
MDQGVKKHFAVTLRKRDRFMAGNRGLRRLGQRCQTKVCKASVFQRSGSFYQLFCSRVHTKAEA